MDDVTELEQREIPSDPDLRNAARKPPHGRIYDTEHAYPISQPTPPEAIRGAWEVGADGRLTGTYARNGRYRPIEHCDRPLKPSMHAGARSNRDQWIVEIDPRGEQLFPNIPPTLIRGWWYVDKLGIHYGPLPSQLSMGGRYAEEVVRTLTDCPFGDLP